MPARRASHIRAFTTENSRGLTATAGVLPSGGALEVYRNGKVVDRAVTNVDRNRVHIVRKTVEVSKIFVPLDPNESVSKTHRGVALHTDPFDESRPRIAFRKGKAKVATPRGPEREPRRVSKPVPRTEHVVKPHDFICANGIRHMSPKRVTPSSFTTTYQLEQKPKTFNGNRRFAHSGDKVAQRPVSATINTARSQLSPFAITDATSGLQSGATTYRSLSNAFFDQGSILALGNGPVESETRRPAVRLSITALTTPTMEGVFSPMRNGRVPKPQPVVAPWAKEVQVCAPTGLRHIHNHTTVAPFAIQA